MSDPSNLTELYIEQLQDLWSANDQMKDVVNDMTHVAGDTLAGRLRRSVEGIQNNTELLKTLIEEAGGQLRKETCKGMEGLVTEGRKHALEADLDGAVRDVAIITQYQRMCHYGIAGFGTAKAFAQVLNEDSAAKRLDEALSGINESDDYMTQLAERSKNLEANAG